MKNVTLSVDEGLIMQARRYAHRYNTTLNQLIRDLLSQKVLPSSEHMLQEAFELLDAHPSTLKNYHYHREDAYDV